MDRNGDEKKILIAEESDIKKRRDKFQLKYANHKYIPFCCELGFLTLSVSRQVRDILDGLCSGLGKKDDCNNKIKGICFGKKIDKEVKLEECFEFKYNAENKIIIDGESYETNLKFLGIYTNDEIPDDEDIAILKEWSERLNCSLFLLAFTTCEDLNEASIVIYENVFDIATHNWLERLISKQLYLHEGTLETDNDDCKDKDKTIFHLPLLKAGVILFQRYNPNIAASDWAKVDDSIPGLEIVPLFDDVKETLLNYVVDEGWKFENFLSFDTEKNYPKMVHNFCKKAKIQVLYTFSIPIDRTNPIHCEVTVLNCGMAGTLRPTMKECYNRSALQFIEFMIAKRIKFYKNP